MNQMRTFKSWHFQPYYLSFQKSFKGSFGQEQAFSQAVSIANSSTNVSISKEFKGIHSIYRFDEDLRKNELYPRSTDDCLS